MIHPEWKNTSLYSGALDAYQYSVDKEYGELLQFLKKVDNRSVSIHLTDENNWSMTLPPADYDVYIVCSFGEFVNEAILHDMDQMLGHKELILLTSQYYDPTDLKNFKIFCIEHLQTLTRFFQPEFYCQLNQRPNIMATQSRRNALHKSLITQRLLSRFPDLQYTFCNQASTEYQIETLREDLQTVLAVSVEENEIQKIIDLHANPKIIPGYEWDITNLYKESKLFWTTESIFLSRDNCPTAYITEKTIKPIIAGCAFIIAGQKHTYRRIRNLGFETFETDFDINFDDDNDQQRIFSLNSIIDNTDFDSILSRSTIQDKINYNYNHFFNHLTLHAETRNEIVIQDFIDYVNSL